MRRFITIITGITLLVLLNIHSAQAIDRLILSGVVKAVDYKSGIITVDVKSASCPGIKKFRVDDLSISDTSLIGKHISFPIDSSTCKGDTIYKIVLPRGEGR